MPYSEYESDGLNLAKLVKDTGNNPVAGKQNSITENVVKALYNLNRKIGEDAGGDMTKVVYDPTAKKADAFDMDNMDEGTTKKILTAIERGLLVDLAAGDYNTGGRLGTQLKAGGALIDLTWYGWYNLIFSGTEILVPDASAGTGSRIWITRSGGSQALTFKASGGTRTVNGVDYADGETIFVLPAGSMVEMVASVNVGDWQMDISSVENYRFSWNEDFYTFNIDSTLGPVLQIGQEQYLLYYNDTGVQIDNGQVVRPKAGTLVGTEVIPTPELAQADCFCRCEGTITIATMDIPIGEVGLCTRYGRLVGIDTSGFAPGDDLFLSPTVPGGITNVRPSFPDYEIKLGGCLVSDATDGIIVVSVTTNVSDTTHNFWNGTCREAFDFRITEAGGVVTGSLEPSGSSTDLTLLLSSGFYTFDTSPAATIVLTAGTDVTPQTNYVYILGSTKALTVSIVGWPATEHIKIAQVLLRSAATTGTDGALRNQNINDEIMSEGGNGHLSHMGERIRQLESQWDSGAAASLTGTTANVYFGTTSGIIYQMHKQTYPAQQMPADDIHVVNDFASPYRTTTNLNDLTVDSQNVTLNNKWFSLVVWGVINKTGEVSHLMCNLPNGSYNSEVDAQSDAAGYSDYTIPVELRGVGFLIGRFTIRKSGAVFTYNGGNSYQDLRGFMPNTTAGSGAGGSGITEWTGLTDTPSSLTGEKFKVPSIAVGETALELVNPGSVKLINAQTGTTYTPVLTDQGKIVTLSNIAAIVMTLPLAASVAFPQAAGYSAILEAVQIGAGAVTIRGAVGVSINGIAELGGGESDVVLAGQYKAGRLFKDGTNSWVAIV